MTPDQLEAALFEIKQEQVRMGEQIKAALKRIDEQKALTESVHALALSVEKMAITQKQIEKNVEDLSQDVDELKQKPARNWNTVITVGLTAAVTAIVTLVLTKLGLK